MPHEQPGIRNILIIYTDICLYKVLACNKKVDTFHYTIQAYVQLCVLV